MSVPAVEAKSLSTLTALASNPPSYPRNPTHVRNDPLVLYIARVPGSKDVFLSPMKPRERVVTAEDIQSSLYYIHVDQPDDARLITSVENSEIEGRSPLPPHRPPVPSIQRKAIPATLAPPTTVPHRKPVEGTLAPIGDFEKRQNASAANYARPSQGMLGPGYSPRHSSDSNRYSGDNERPPLPPRRLSDFPTSAGVALTLIRRDPVSGAQWNIARIDDLSSLDVSSSALDDQNVKKQTGAPVHIAVTNPGYSKFRNDPERPTSQRSQPSPFTSGPVSAELPFSSITPSNASTGVDSSVATFRRRLWMEGTKYNGGFGHRKINSHDASIGRQSPRSSYEAFSQDGPSNDLQQSSNPQFLNRDDQAYKAINPSERQSNFRGYVFMSPWNGRCEFITGVGGGSLKCRHVIAGPQGVSPMAMPVSELRFNLPSSSKSSTPMGDETSKRSSFFHRPRNHRNNSSASEMDLSLGQEFAGGGFGGRQAKLGKLIIEDEGLKMLDLLVAANMALWWRAYDRVDLRSRSDRGSFQG